MASPISLPALDLRPLQQPDPISQMMKLQQFQQGRQQLQLQQQQVADQKASAQALLGWDGKDPADLAKSALRNGASSNAAIGLQKHYLDAKDTASQMALRDAQTGETTLKTAIDKHNQYLGAITAAEQVPDDKLPQHLTDTINQLIPPTEQDPQSQQFKQQAMQVIQSGAPAAQLRQQIDLYKKGLQGSKEQYTQAQIEAETSKNMAQAGEATNQAALSQNKLQIINAWKQDPQKVLSQVDSIVPPTGPNAALNQRTKGQVWFALQRGDIDSATAALKQAAEQVGAVEKDVQAARATMPFKIQQAAGEAAATMPYKIQQAAGEAAATQPYKIQTAQAEGTAIADRQISTKRQETADTQYQTAIGADERLNRMEKSYTDATQNHNQQAMLALLTDHIGMTLGLQKGARITKDILNEAAQSQPWLAKMASKFDSDGYLSGVNLSGGQMKQMLDLGYAARENAWGAAGNTAQMYGVKPPPNATAVYNKRDPNARVYDKPAMQVGQTVSIKGKQMKVTAVYPNGSFDAQ